METMIAWINVAILAVSAVLFLVFYVKSVQPAALEREIGEAAYRRCARYRLLSSVPLFVATANYVIYVFYPLPIGLPRTFPWPWWVSALIAVLIAVPSGYLWYRGIKDAGEETMMPKKTHTLYDGIYETIRHPQAAGELMTWWVIAFLLHSPSLAIISFVWVPLFFVACLAEERDLVLRYGEAYRAYQQRTGFVLPKSRDRAASR